MVLEPKISFTLISTENKKVLTTLGGSLLLAYYLYYKVSGKDGKVKAEPKTEVVEQSPEKTPEKANDPAPEVPQRYGHNLQPSFDVERGDTERSSFEVEPGTLPTTFYGHRSDEEGTPNENGTTEASQTHSPSEDRPPAPVLSELNMQDSFVILDADDIRRQRCPASSVPEQNGLETSFVDVKLGEAV